MILESQVGPFMSTGNKWVQTLTDETKKDLMDAEEHRSLSPFETKQLLDDNKNETLHRFKPSGVYRDKAGKAFYLQAYENPKGTPQNKRKFKNQEACSAGTSNKLVQPINKYPSLDAAAMAASAQTCSLCRSFPTATDKLLVQIDLVLKICRLGSSQPKLWWRIFLLDCSRQVVLLRYAALSALTP